MHFGEPEHLIKNEFQFVVCKHQSRFDLVRIQKCQFYAPHHLFQFLDQSYKVKRFHRMMSEHLSDQPSGSGYLFTLKENDLHDVAMVSFEPCPYPGRAENQFHDEFQFVVYKHRDFSKKVAWFHPVGEPLSTDLKEKLLCGAQAQPWYQMTSIQNCQTARPKALLDFLSRTLVDRRLARLIQKYLVAEPFEESYVVNMESALNGELRICNVRRVSESEDHNSFLRLH